MSIAGMTFADLGKQPPTQAGEMLIQAIAILSGLRTFQAMSPSEIFDYIAKQAEEVREGV